MESNKVNVKIYGQEFTIAGASSREHIMKVADYVDTKMHEIAAGVANRNTATLAVLAAVNAADDYYTVLEKNKDLQATNEQLSKDTEHYIKLWDESKINFVQYKEDAQIVAKQKDEFMAMVNDREREIQRLKDELKQCEENAENASIQALSEANEKCRELESNFFDLQMENIQLKSELERCRKQLEFK